VLTTDPFGQARSTDRVVGHVGAVGDHRTNLDGLILGWPAVFIAMFVAGLLSAVVSLGLLVSRRAGLQSYIPFGPFLVAGTVITLLREPGLLGPMAITLTTFLRA